MGNRIRDGLLRDNKVLPAVLGLLALLIFAWLIAGAIMGVPDEEEATQSSLAQGQDSESGPQETPALGAENRDTDSYSAFESKDPFRSLIPKADEGKGGKGKADQDKAGENKAGEGKAGESKGGEPKSREPKGSTPPRGDRPGATPPGGDRPSAIPPDEGGTGGASGGPGGGAPDGGNGGDQQVPGDPNFGGGPPQDAAGQGALEPDVNGNLFNSGGDLPMP